MIVGVGTDIVQIARLRAVLARSGERFARKVLGPQELAEFEARSRQHESRAVHFLAKRFAAKEAFCKALGTGFRAPMSWHGLQILNNAQGRPEPHYGPTLHDYLAARNWRAHIALSDEADYALAFVTLEQIDSNGAHHGTELPDHANHTK